MTRPRTAVLGAAAAAAAAFGIAAVPATAATPSTTSAPSAAAAACDRGPWQASVQGWTSVRPGMPGGDYLYHDSAGFHLRVTHAHNDRRVYTGVITSNEPMRIDPVKLERGDSVRLSANHRSLTFVFANYGYIDGVNFHTDCATALAVTHLNVGNRPISTSQVYLGGHKVHPNHVPFLVHRILPTPAS